MISLNSLIVVPVAILIISAVATVNGNEVFTCTPTCTCKDIKKQEPSSRSGQYQVRNSETSYIDSIDCFMETLCGSAEGWTRIAHINMTLPMVENCPDGLQLYQANGKKACGRPASSGGSCHSSTYPSHGQYSKVCGRMIGYQYAMPDAIDTTYRDGAINDINSFYVDGVSLTRGSTRKHIFTYMAGFKEDNSNREGTFSCPCQTGSKQANLIPSFIGDDYFCESGNHDEEWGTLKLLTDDPLWDGKLCRGLESPCCEPAGRYFPWFYKDLGTPMNDFIEMRVCCDQTTEDEDVTIEQLEIYVN